MFAKSSPRSQYVCTHGPMAMTHAPAYVPACRPSSNCCSHRLPQILPPSYSRSLLTMLRSPISCSSRISSCGYSSLHRASKPSRRCRRQRTCVRCCSSSRLRSTSTVQRLISSCKPSCGCMRGHESVVPCRCLTGLGQPPCALLRFYAWTCECRFLACPIIVFQCWRLSLDLRAVLQWSIFRPSWQPCKPSPLPR